MWRDSYRRNFILAQVREIFMSTHEDANEIIRRQEQEIASLRAELDNFRGVAPDPGQSGLAAFIERLATRSISRDSQKAAFDARVAAVFAMYGYEFERSSFARGTGMVALWKFVFRDKKGRLGSIPVKGDASPGWQEDFTLEQLQRELIAGAGR